MKTFVKYFDLPGTYAYGCYHLFSQLNTLQFQFNSISVRRVYNLYHHYKNQQILNTKI